MRKRIRNVKKGVTKTNAIDKYGFEKKSYTQKLFYDKIFKEYIKNWKSIGKKVKIRFY